MISLLTHPEIPLCLLRQFQEILLLIKPTQEKPIFGISSPQVVNFPYVNRRVRLVFRTLPIVDSKKHLHCPHFQG